MSKHDSQWLLGIVAGPTSAVASSSPPVRLTRVVGVMRFSLHFWKDVPFGPSRGTIVYEQLGAMEYVPAFLVSVVNGDFKLRVLPDCRVAGSTPARQASESDLSAGGVEEIVIVALPVIVGRRAGWHPLVIVGISVVLRWPFHIYHGLFPSLPWTMIWGGANVLAFLYLRRLLPLIAVHAIYDAQIDMRSAYGEAGWWVVVAVGAGLVLFLVGRTIAGRRRRLLPGPRAAGPGIARFVLTHQDRSIYWLAAAAAALVFAYTAAMIADSPDPSVVWTVPGALVVFLAVAAALGLARWRISNAVVRRDPVGSVTAVVRWHTSYTGDNVVDTAIGLADVEAIAEIAGYERRDVMLPGTKKRRRELAAAGIPITETGFLRRLRIDPADLPMPARR